MKTFFPIIFLLVLGLQIKSLQSQTIGWTQLNYTPSTVLYSVYCINYDTVIAVGYNGYIIRTTDGGDTWNSIPSNTTNTLLKIIFVNDSIGYAVGENGTILKTNDIGQNWTNIGITTNLNLLSLSFINKDTGWVAGGILDPNIFCPYGNKGILLKTVNGGANWMADSSYDKTLASVCFIDKDTGYIALNSENGSYGNITMLQKTTNEGNSFFTIKQDSLIPLGYYSDITFTNDSIFFNSSTTPDFGKDGIYNTTDFGATWNKVLTQWSIYRFYALESCFLYLSYSDMPGSGAYGKDICTNTDLSCPQFTGIHLLNKDSGYCVSDFIFKRGIVTGMKNSIDNYNLNVFPNPFIDKITLCSNFDTNVSDIDICVLDMFGREITNTHSFSNLLEIDLSGRTKGLYFLVVKNNGAIIFNEKLVKL